MKTRRIGSLEVSVVGIGGNTFGTEFWGNASDQAATTRIIFTALDAGINLIDTAEEYSTPTRMGTGRSEEFIANALGSRRDEVVIASKFSVAVPEAPEERGARRIISAVEGSLKRLRTDRIDLYQQHFPDPATPIDEILEALTRLVKDGKVREIGCSNFDGPMIDAAQAASAAAGLSRFVSTQNQYNLLDPPEDGVIEACKTHGVMLLPFFPLASGLLTGKYRKGKAADAGTRFASDTKVTDVLKPKQLTDERIAKVEKLDAFARERGHSLLELAISWLTSQPFVGSVIAGATRPEQIKANAEASGWCLTAEDFSGVAAILADQPHARLIRGR
jgi:aryl-alcohol dehydrogenase-like predicted oxidoreductase